MTFTETWYSAEQAQLITDLAVSVKDLGNCVEIGCWEGFSTCYLLRGIAPEPLYCIDHWQGNVKEFENHVTVTALAQRDVYATFVSNVSEFDNAVVIKFDWRDVLSKMGCIAFIHIDAEHDYQSVMDCLEMAYPLMASGGVMCGDDFRTASIDRSDLNGGVERAVREFFDSKGIYINTQYNAWWINTP